MCGLPSALGIFAIGLGYARQLAWILFLKLLSTVVGAAANFFEKLSEAKPRESVSSGGEKFELLDVEEESAFLEEEEELKPLAKFNPLNLVLSDDILPEILKHLDAESLKSIRLVSRHWCQLATPILASRAEVQLYTVDRRTHNVEYESEGLLSLERSRPVNHFIHFLAWRDSKEEASDRRLISYQHFKLIFASWLVNPFATFPQNLRLFLLPRVQESLVSLILQGLHLGWLRIALGNLPQLKSLKLEINWYHDEDRFAENAPEEELNQLDVEPGSFPVLRRLEELSVDRGDPFPRGDAHQWYWIFGASPNLTSVKLKFRHLYEMHDTLENLFDLYRGCGLERLHCQDSYLPLEERYRFGSHRSYTERLVPVLHKILSTDRLSRDLKYFVGDIPLTPIEWTQVFRTTKTTPLGSPLETLSLNIFTLESRAEFVNDFLLLCPTFAGEAYWRRLKSLSLCVWDPLAARGLENSSESSQSDGESLSPPSEVTQVLKSSRILPQLMTLSFLYFSDVNPYQQLSQHFFKPFPNLKSLTTNVDTGKCVTAIFRHVPPGLEKLSLKCSSESMCPLKLEDFCGRTSNVESIVELHLNLDSSLVTGDAVFVLTKHLKRLVFGSYPLLDNFSLYLLMKQDVATFYMEQGRLCSMNCKILWEENLKKKYGIVS